MPHLNVKHGLGDKRLLGQLAEDPAGGGHPENGRQRAQHGDGAHAEAGDDLVVEGVGLLLAAVHQADPRLFRGKQDWDTAGNAMLTPQPDEVEVWG